MGTSKKKRFVPEIGQALPISIVDNHTHLAPLLSGTPDEQRKDEEARILPPVLRETLLSGMRQMGIKAAISSGCEYEDLMQTVRLAQENQELWAALAIHPNEAPMHAQSYEQGPDGIEWSPKAVHLEISLDEAIAEVARLAQLSEVVAIGETGLDYFRTGDSGKAAQKESFRAHIALAKELGKPMQIHDREAHADVVEILLADGAPEKTVFHCFSGDVELAKICAENGWYASFAGNITYPSNESLQAAARELPAELILLETDAPYLTPVPYRGHPNTVWAVAYTARFLAELRESDLSNWCSQIAKNSFEVYGI